MQKKTARNFQVLAPSLVQFGSEGDPPGRLAFCSLHRFKLRCTKANEKGEPPMATTQGFFEYVGDIAALEAPVQFMRFCEKCDSEQIFIAGWECDRGLVGYCVGCSDERIAPFTRSNTGFATDNKGAADAKAAFLLRPGARGRRLEKER